MNRTGLSHLSVADLLAAAPEAARVFIRFQMGCVGCTFAPFETVTEVAAVYRIPLVEFVAALADAGVDADGFRNHRDH
jgi:hybrid cluster-associated redox disulfide protein